MACSPDVVSRRAHTAQFELETGRGPEAILGEEGGGGGVALPTTGRAGVRARGLNDVHFETDLTLSLGSRKVGRGERNRLSSRAARPGSRALGFYPT